MTLLRYKQSPTYLHFLDRELRRAENAPYNDKMILDAIIVASMNSLSYCYCSASILIESNIQFPKSTNLLLELEKFELVRLLTNEHSFNEFIESRQKLYAHKQDRYPMYFKNDSSSFWPNKPLFVNSSTTSELRANIYKWLDKSDESIKIDKSNFKKKDLKNIEKTLNNEKGKAITLDLFLSKKELSINNKRRESGR